MVQGEQSSGEINPEDAQKERGRRHAMGCRQARAETKRQKNTGKAQSRHTGRCRNKEQPETPQDRENAEEAQTKDSWRPTHGTKGMG